MKRLGAILVALLLAAEALACTTAVVSAGASKSGRPMLWKQRDANDPYNIIARVTGGKYAYTGLFPTSDTLHTKCYAGINEAGFALINNLSYNMRPDSVGFDTVAGPFMARALAECATVEEFMAFLEAEPVPRGLSTNFGVADSHGGAAYFEAGDSTFVRYDVPDGEILYRTNFSLSGDPSRGRGRERYETMDVLTEPPGLFDPRFFMQTGRSFIKDGHDDLARASSLLETGYIPRTTTVSSLVIECPIREGEHGIMWCAIGYIPCSYAIPVWEGAEIPSVLQGEANLFSVELFKSVHDGKTLDARQLRKIIRLVVKAERKELLEGTRVDRKLHKTGFDPSLVRRFNDKADMRFKRFKKRLAI